jgi:ketosteroid isomerase-like protein
MAAADLMREIWEPIERGQREDLGAFYDALDDEVTFKFSFGELNGKRAVVAYFESNGETLEFAPFEKPLEYFGDGDRAVLVGDETVTVRATGAAHTAEWAWVVQVRDGRITHISEIQDVSGFAGPLGQVIARSQAAA